MEITKKKYSMPSSFSNAASSSSSWRERADKVLSPAYGWYSNLVIDHAQGAHLYTIDGQDILDFGCGIGVTNLGHNHPVVVDAVRKQMDKLWHMSDTAYNTPMIEAAEVLVATLPDPLDQVFFCNSGAEAVEGALKLARRATGRSEIIAFTGAFHGRTYGAISATASKVAYHRGIGPFLPGIHHVPYPYCFRVCEHTPDEPCPIAAGEYIETLFKTIVPPDSVAAVLVEPIIGEGGYVVPPDTFMPNLRALCDKYGILLIADEVQTGFARTGRMFAIEHTQTIPDIMCMAKGLGNGFPVAAFASSRDIMGRWNPGEHGSTYGGNPMACAAVKAVVETIIQENLSERSDKMGQYIMHCVGSWGKRFPTLVDVRGRGLMIGLEFMKGKESAPDIVEKIRTIAAVKGLMVLSCGIDYNVIRLVPPITISQEDVDAGLDILESAIAEATKDE